MMQSYNGWPASTDRAAIGIVPLEVLIDGTVYRFPGGCKAGDVHTLFSDFLPRFHRQIEPLTDGGADEWGYAYRKNRNADNLSCHASGTAVDVNSEEHPNGARRTFTDVQVRALRVLLTRYEGVLKWGGDFSGTTDQMHFEINGTAADLNRIVRKFTAQPAPPKGDLDMVVIYAPGKPTALLSGGKLTPLGSNAEKDALAAAGVPVKGLTSEQFDLIQQVASR